MTHFIRVIERMRWVGVLVGCVFLAAMVLLTVANIITRQFGAAIVGSYLIVTLMAVFVIPIAIIHTQMEKGHIAIGVVISRFPYLGRVILTWIVGVLSIGIWGLAAWASLQYAWDKWVGMELLDPLYIPASPFKFIWGIGLILVCSSILAVLFQTLSREKRR